MSEPDEFCEYWRDMTRFGVAVGVFVIPLVGLVALPLGGGGRAIVFFGVIGVAQAVLCAIALWADVVWIKAAVTLPVGLAWLLVGWVGGVGRFDFWGFGIFGVAGIYVVCIVSMVVRRLFARPDDQPLAAGDAW